MKGDVSGYDADRFCDGRTPAPRERVAGLRHRIAHGRQSLSPTRRRESARLSAPGWERLIRSWTEAR